MFQAVLDIFQIYYLIGFIDQSFEAYWPHFRVEGPEAQMVSQSQMIGTCLLIVQPELVLNSSSCL